MTTTRTTVLLTTALTLSLSLNAFFVGTHVSRWHGPPDGFPGGPRFEHMGERDGPPGERHGEGPDGERGDGPPKERLRMLMKKFMERIPDEDKGPIQKSMEETRPIVEEKIKGVEAARGDAANALRAEPFDAEKLRDALAVQRAAQVDIQATVHESLIKAIEQMTPEQRQRLGKIMDRLFR